MTTPVSGDSIIVVLAKGNPRRSLTAAAWTFQQYRHGMTVREWRQAVIARDAPGTPGHRLGYLRPDEQAGHIAILPPGTDYEAYLRARNRG